MRILICILALVLLCGCREVSAQNVTQVSAVDPDDVPALVTDMLLRTDETMQLYLPDAGAYDFDSAIRNAAEQHVLARTMLRSVTWTRSGDCVTLSAQYAVSADILRKEKQLLADSAELWCRESASQPDAVRILLAHDALCRRCTYSDALPECHSAYGAWCGQNAVCDGYAEALALLMETAGIPVRIVTGTAQDGSHPAAPHAWNLVELSGVWYHIDCTWDDADGLPQHAYFLCDDAAMSLTHQWDTEKYPPALGGGYTYDSIVSEMLSKVRGDGCADSG